MSAHKKKTTRYAWPPYIYIYTVYAIHSRTQKKIRATVRKNQERKNKARKSRQEIQDKKSNVRKARQKKQDTFPLSFVTVVSLVFVPLDLFLRFRIAYTRLI